MAAFRAAFDSGLDGIECDVQRSRDGVLVLHHDFEIEGRAVRDLTLAELRSLDPHLATLGALLVLADTHPGRLLNLELKSDRLRDGGLARSLAAAVRSAGLADRVLVSSFNPWALLTLRLVEPSLRTAMLFAPDLPRSLRSPWLAGWAACRCPPPTSRPGHGRAAARGSETGAYGQHLDRQRGR